MKTNQEYKNAALDALKGNWPKAVIVTIIYLAVAVLASGGRLVDVLPNVNQALQIVGAGATLLLTILVLVPLEIGYANAFRFLYQNADDNLTPNFFNITLNQYVHLIWGGLLVGIKTVLWSLLLIIPGIIKAFAYAMTPFILVDEPELSASEAIARSEQMMKGHKFDLFYLYLSFIGWFFLSILTIGIGFLWLYPYTETAVAAFYQSLKEEQAWVAGEPQIVISEPQEEK